MYCAQIQQLKSRIAPCNKHNFSAYNKAKNDLKLPSTLCKSKIPALQQPNTHPVLYYHAKTNGIAVWLLFRVVYLGCQRQIANEGQAPTVNRRSTDSELQGENNNRTT